MDTTAELEKYNNNNAHIYFRVFFMFSNIYMDELKRGRQMYATKCIRELPTYQRDFGMELGIRSKIGKIKSDRSY